MLDIELLQVDNLPERASAVLQSCPMVVKVIGAAGKEGMLRAREVTHLLCSSNPGLSFELLHIHRLDVNVSAE